jgi:hypothetical protein
MFMPSAFSLIFEPSSSQGLLDLLNSLTESTLSKLKLYVGVVHVQLTMPVPSTELWSLKVSK